MAPSGTQTGLHVPDSQDPVLVEVWFPELPLLSQSPPVEEINDCGCARLTRVQVLHIVEFEGQVGDSQSLVSTAPKPLVVWQPTYRLSLSLHYRRTSLWLCQVRPKASHLLPREYRSWGFASPGTGIFYARRVSLLW